MCTTTLVPRRPMVRARAYARCTAVGLMFALAGAPATLAAQQPAAPKRTPDVIFVPTPPEVVMQMLTVARVGKNDIVYDLGSGDGRIVVTAARRFGARGVGIDIAPERIAESRLNADTSGVTDRVEFRLGDLFETDLHEASVVTLYLLPELNVKLRPKLFAELRPGTRIVSHDFDMGDWQPDTMMTVKSRTRGESKVYFWVLPANVAGTWNVATASGGAERRYTVRFDQKYQRITGTAVASGRTLPLTDARLTGDRIAFTVVDPVGGRPDSLDFSGRVKGDTMRGTAGHRSWTASRAPGASSGASRPTERAARSRSESVTIRPPHR